MVDLGPFDVLLSVAALGSMGRAAAAHGVTQAAVSARIRSLEGALGVTLLERSPRGTRLTPTGALVADWARVAVDAADALDAGVTSLRAEQAARLRVAASLTVAEYLLPRWLVALRAELPETSVSLTSRNSTDVAARRARPGTPTSASSRGRRCPTTSIRRSSHGTGSSSSSPPTTRGRPAGGESTSHGWRRRRSSPASTDPAPGRSSSTQSDVPSPSPRCSWRRRRRSRERSPPAWRPAVLSSLAVAGELAAGTLATVGIAAVDLERRLAAVWPAWPPADGTRGRAGPPRRTAVGLTPRACPIGVLRTFPCYDTETHAQVVRRTRCARSRPSRRSGCSSRGCPRRSRAPRRRRSTGRSRCRR